VSLIRKPEWSRDRSRQRRGCTDWCICEIMIRKPKRYLGCLCWCIGVRWSTFHFFTSTPTSEPFLVLALLLSVRDFALGWWRGIVKLHVKVRVVHINADLSESGGIAVSRIGERRSERHRLLFITDYHTFLYKVSRNPHDLSLVIHCPRLGHSNSNSLFRTRNGLEWFHHESGARLALSEDEIAIRTVVATTWSRRSSSRRDET
jgi:hypothetical protein